MSEFGLFDMEPAAVKPPPEPVERLSADRRRTIRQQDMLARGWHPALRHIRLHAEAAPVEDRTAPGLRCGGCAHADTYGHHNRTYIKCDLTAITHGAGSDIRAWWPACQRWEAP